MAAALRNEERIGLAAALVAHAGLVALLLWHPHSAPVVTPPDRIAVTISDQMADKATSPEPQAQAAPDMAPEIGEPAPPAPEPAPPEPAPPVPPQPRAEPPRPRVERPEPAPAIPPRKPQPRPEPPKPMACPRPVPRPVPRAVQRPEPAKPTAKPAPHSNPRPSAAAAAPSRPSARPAPAARQSSDTPAKPTARPGASRFADAFRTGVPGAQTDGPARTPPAAVAGPDVKASIGQAISRQVRPHWSAPQGADAELLVTKVRFRLARDGSLIGDPQIVNQSGETAANAAQKVRHGEQAIRAIRLAAPFDLPDQYYSVWQTVTLTFDKRLSQ